MIFENFIIFGIPLITFVASIFMNHRLVKARQFRGLAGLWLLWLGFTVSMFFGMENASGWDGLGYAVALAVVSVPGAVGGFIGGLLGWLKQETVTHA